MSETRRTHSPRRIEAFNEFLNLTKLAMGENDAQAILENPDPWVREVMLLERIEASLHCLKDLQRKVDANVKPVQ